MIKLAEELKESLPFFALFFFFFLVDGARVHINAVRSYSCRWSTKYLDSVGRLLNY